ncbi:MAG: hypothetical protein PHS41_08315 [Victivallaceae bacterium]|nr:hypothetical protein [Victivallaceae bacterium]
MNFFSMLLAFLPWVLYKVIMDVPLFDDMTMLKASVVFAFAACIWQTVNKSGRGILHWGTVGFFAVTLILVVLWPKEWYLKRLGIFSGGMLTALVWGSILFRRPFTLVYAKAKTDPSRWNHPNFIRRNYQISIFWGVVMLIGIGFSILKAMDWHRRMLYDILDNVVLILAIAVTCIFSRKPKIAEDHGKKD